MNSVANLALAGHSHVGDIAFVDLKAQQGLIRERIEARLKAVLDHGKYIAGPEIDELEAALAARTGAKVAIACASGTAALIIPLLARGLTRRDAVFLPAFTYNATANAVLLAGATPVFVDIDPASFTMDPADLDARIEEVRRRGDLRPRAIVPVDVFGAPADYAAIAAVAERRGLDIFADGAQSFGARHDGREVGNVAPVTATSFFPGKALGAYGDAGAILARSDEEAEFWRSIRWHGTDEDRKISVRVGFNGRMDSFQAAILLEKLAIFDDELAARRRIGAAYDARLSSVGVPQRDVEGAISSRSYYTIRLANRDAVAEKLKAFGVPTAVYYSTPLHLMPAFSAFAPEGGLAETEALCAEAIALPMHPYLTPDQVDFICEAVEAAAEAAREKA